MHLKDFESETRCAVCLGEHYLSCTSYPCITLCQPSFSQGLAHPLAYTSAGPQPTTLWAEVRASKVPAELRHCTVPKVETKTCREVAVACQGLRSDALLAGIVKDCRLVSGCMHRFCSECIEKWLRVAR